MISLTSSFIWSGQSVLLGMLLFFPLDGARAAENEKSTNQVSKALAVKPLSAALSAGKWRQVEDSVDRALAWIASQQAADGSFPTLPAGQPAVTSLCVMAFLSRGHLPGFGPYGQRLNRAIDFVVSCQMSNGLISFQPPGPMHQDKSASHGAVYNHAIAGLMLGEVFGHVTGQRGKDVKQAIEKALLFTRELQVRPKTYSIDKGGWRYLRLRFNASAPDSDLLVTAWQLMFLRSARNAEFKVPQAHIDEAMAFLHRCWDENHGIFNYALVGGDIKSSRGIVAAGILSLSMAGQHQTRMALTAGEWLLANPFREFGQSIGVSDRFFYSTYYCSQAAAQLGGRYWEGIFPPIVKVLLRSQLSDGSWPPEPSNGDAVFGNAYTTAMAVLSLTPPYQLLPVFQR
jgi:hypothetical protein